jgi:DNA-directed RNA polymerase subunit RPC12/RpoP
MYRVTYSSPKSFTRCHRKKHPEADAFMCLHCSAEVSIQSMLAGVQNRNHCPYCLCSRHMDHAQAGDRLSACKAIMLPVGLTVKRSHNKYGRSMAGELMLIHWCSECGKLSINRIAADDQVEGLMEIFMSSMSLHESRRIQIRDNGIQLLTAEDIWIVERQLLGIPKQ